MVVDKRNLTLEQVADLAYKDPKSDYADGFVAELKQNGWAVRNRGPRGKVGKGKVLLNLFVQAKQQKNGLYAYKESIDREWPKPTSRWMTSFKKTKAAACRCPK